MLAFPLKDCTDSYDVWFSRSWGEEERGASGRTATKSSVARDDRGWCSRSRGRSPSEACGAIAGHDYGSTPSLAGAVRSRTGGGLRGESHDARDENLVMHGCLICCRFVSVCV